MNQLSDFRPLNSRKEARANHFKILSRKLQGLIRLLPGANTDLRTYRQKSSQILLSCVSKEQDLSPVPRPKKPPSIYLLYWAALYCINNSFAQSDWQIAFHFPRQENSAGIGNITSLLLLESKTRNTFPRVRPGLAYVLWKVGRLYSEYTRE